MINPFISKEITANAVPADWGEVSIGSNVTHFHLFSADPIVLSDDWELYTNDSPSEGDLIIVYYDCYAALNGHTITIFGYSLKQTQSKRKNIFYARYSGSAWEVFAVESFDTYGSKNAGVDNYYIDTSGGTQNIDSGVNNDYIVLNHNIAGQSLTVDYIVQPNPGYNFEDGDQFWFMYEGDINYVGNVSITIFGEELTQGEANSADVMVYAKYDAGLDVWHVKKFGASSVTNNTVVIEEAGGFRAGTQVCTPGENTITFSTAMPDTDFAVALNGFADDGLGNYYGVAVGLKTIATSGLVVVVPEDCTVHYTVIENR